MSARSLLALFIVILLSGCHSTIAKLPGFGNAHEPQATSRSIFSTSTTNSHSMPITALYQTPAHDAKIALSVQDLRLLSLDTSPTQLLGVAQHHPIDKIQENCGIRVLPNPTINTLSTFASEQIQQMRLYITEYNRLVFQACLPKMTFRAY